MQPAELAQLAVGGEALRRTREGYSAERLPDVGPDGGGHGVFADIGELVDVGVFEGSAERVDDLLGVDIGVDEDVSAMLARTDGLESL